MFARQSSMGLFNDRNNFSRGYGLAGLSDYLKADYEEANRIVNLVIKALADIEYYLAARVYLTIPDAEAISIAKNLFDRNNNDAFDYALYTYVAGGKTLPTDWPATIMNVRYDNIGKLAKDRIIALYKSLNADTPFTATIKEIANNPTKYNVVQVGKMMIEALKQSSKLVTANNVKSIELYKNDVDIFNTIFNVGDLTTTSTYSAEILTQLERVTNALIAVNVPLPTEVGKDITKYKSIISSYGKNMAISNLSSMIYCRKIIDGLKPVRETLIALANKAPITQPTTPAVQPVTPTSLPKILIPIAAILATMLA